MANNPGCCVSLVISSGDHTINYNVMNECIMFLSIVTFYLGLYFISTHFPNLARLSVLNSWWPLSRVENNERTFFGMAKRGPRPLNKALTSNIILQLLQGFAYWPLMRGRPLQ